MFTKFRIKNFRCFKDLTLDNLARLNLIGGMNNVGKTSILEAIFLHLGSHLPDIPLRINSFRGIEIFNNNPESMWGWLFYQKNIHNHIELIAIEDNKIAIELLIKEKQEELDFSELQSEKNIKISSSSTTTIGSQELVFSYTKGSQKAESSLLIMNDGSIRGKREHINLMSGVFIVSQIRSIREDAERFSNLEKVNQQTEIIEALQLLEPRLIRLAVLVESGLPIIAGDIGIGELVPISYMGEGLSRLLSIILAIANTQNGVILIDEIENGLHYSKMVDIWKAIDCISQKNNTQIFATTHSMECIESANQAFLELESDNFRYYRLERDKQNNEIKVLTYDKETINTSVELQLEMR